MITRNELLHSPEYWIAQIQISIYRAAEKFMRDKDMNRTQFAQYLGVTKGYVSQLLNGDYNYSIGKLVDLSLKMGMVPEMSFTPVEVAVGADLMQSSASFSSDSFQVTDNQDLSKAA